MITAREAATVSKSSAEGFVSKHIDRIDVQIKMAAEGGLFQCVYVWDISDAVFQIETVIDIVELSGYTVKPDGNDMRRFYIYWDR